MERADLPAFLFSDTPCQSIEGNIQQAGFGTSLECTTFAYRQVGACRDFDLFDPTEAVADFEYQIGFIFGFDGLTQNWFDLLYFISTNA